MGDRVLYPPPNLAFLSSQYLLQRLLPDASPCLYDIEKTEIGLNRDMVHDIISEIYQFRYYREESPHATTPHRTGRPL